MVQFSSQAGAMLERMTLALNEAQTKQPPLDAPANVDDFTMRLALLDLVAPSIYASELDDEEIKHLLSVTNPASKAGFTGMYSLPRHARMNALSSLGDGRRALEILQAMPLQQRAQTLVQIQFEKLLQANVDEIPGEALTATEGQSLGALYALKEANERAQALGVHILKREQIEAAIEAARTIAPFEHLLTEHFVGREDELLLLRDFVGLRDDGRALAKNAMSERILVIEGGGGSGKTALLGHFLLKARQQDREIGFPFGYLACDDPTIDVQRPETIFGETARQLLQQFRSRWRGEAGAVAEIESAHNMFFSQLRSFGQDTEQLGSKVSSYGSQNERFSARRSGLNGLGIAFGQFSDKISRLWHSAGGPPAPVPLIIDTFEQLQYRTQSTMAPMREVFNGWFEADPAARLFLSGRPPVTIPDSFAPVVKRVSLGDLSQSAGGQLLALETGLNVSDIESVLNDVGTNPLDLRLSARILRSQVESAEAAGEKPDLSIAMPQMGQELKRGRLYRRLVEHIHPDIRQLANPGMILRRVSAEVIEKILAPALKIEDVDTNEAERLFGLLMCEHTLVTIDADTLLYRPDVRGPVLRLLEESSASLVREVQERVADYFAHDPRPDWRAEAVYHMLMLDRLDNAALIWEPALSSFLSDALEDLPVAAKIWLAERTDVKLAPEFYAMANAESWLRIVGPQVIERMDAGQLDEAAQLLDDRPGDLPPGSALPVLQARLAIIAEDYAEAATILESALRNFPLGGNGGRRAELCWLEFVARDRLGDIAEADERLRLLVELTRDLSAQLPHIQALAVMSARASFAQQSAAEQSVIHAELYTALSRVDNDAVFSAPDIIALAIATLPVVWMPRCRRLLSMVSSKVPDTLMRARLKPRSGDWSALMRHADRGDETGPIRDELQLISQDSKLTTAEILSLFSLAYKLLDEPRAQEAKLCLPEYATWVILRMMPGDMSASTLAGLDDYREEWELRSDQTVFKA